MFVESLDILAKKQFYGRKKVFLNN
ncbi:hypothetical protein PT2222_140297 [Paraburkholderia tropica]